MSKAAPCLCVWNPFMTDAVDSIALQLTVPETAVDGLTGLCWLLSPRGVLLEDAFTLTSQAENRDAVPVGQTRVTLYVPPAEAESAQALLTSTCAAAQIPAQLQQVPLPNEDWNRVWKLHYKPFNLGKHLRIEPAWLVEPEAAGTIRLVVDPGLAFGTGTHETTRLCLQAVEQWAAVQTGDLAQIAMLDVGTGSGVLGILAVRLGVGRAVGTEIERDAVASAQRNLELNGVADKMTLHHTGDPRDISGKFQLVVANILSSVLLPMAPNLTRKVAPHGTLILSGLLARELPAVTTAYARHGLQPVEQVTENGWAALTMRRR